MNIKLDNSFYLEHFLDCQALTKTAINQVFSLAANLKANKINPAGWLNGKIIASCFFEPSTRTRLSFESAIYRLGGQVIGFSDGQNTSSKKGETITDAIKVISTYAHAIILRQPESGGVKKASLYSSVPVINAGDGQNQHPTQTLIDIFTINETQNQIDGCYIGIVGDLKYSRTIHSLIEALTLFNVRLAFVCPNNLQLPAELCALLNQHNIPFSYHNRVEDIIDQIDILYMTRLQTERFHADDASNQPPVEVLTPEVLGHAKANLKILHPLPRQAELPSAIDNTPCAYYFQQAANGLFVRQALLALILTPPEILAQSVNVSKGHV